MREIYTAPTVEADEVRFEAFRDGWAATYPAMIRAWDNKMKILYSVATTRRKNRRISPARPTAGRPS